MLTGDYILGMAVPALQVPVLVLLVRRKLLREFCFFACYGLYSIIASIAGLWVLNNPTIFFPMYCWAEIGYGVLGLLAIFQVAEPRLLISYRFSRWTRPLPYLIIAGVAVVPLWRALYYPVGRGPFVHLAAGMYAFQVAVVLLEAIIFLRCLTLANQKYYPIRFGRHSFGVLLGFGFAAISTLLVCLARYAFLSGVDEYYRYLLPAFYMAARGTWIAAFWNPEPPETRPIPTLEEINRQIERHQERLDRDIRDLQEARKKLKWPRWFRILTPIKFLFSENIFFCL